MPSTKKTQSTKHSFAKEALSFVVLSSFIIGSGLGIIYYLDSHGTFVQEKPKNIAKTIQSLPDITNGATNETTNKPDDSVATVQVTPVETTPVSQISNEVPPVEAKKSKELGESEESSDSVQTNDTVKPISTDSISSDEDNKKKREEAYLIVFDNFLRQELPIQKDLTAYILQYKSGNYTKQIYYDLESVVERLDALADKVDSVTPPEKYRDMHNLYSKQLNEKFMSTSDFLEGILHKNPEKIQSSIVHTTRSMEIAEQVVSLRGSLPRKN